MKMNKVQILKWFRIVVLSVYILFVLWATIFSRKMGSHGKIMLIPMSAWGVTKEYHRHFIANMFMLLPVGFILPGIADQKVKMVFHQTKCVDDDPMVCTVLFQVLKEMNIISRLFKNHLFPISPLGNVIIPHFTYRSWLNRHNYLLKYGVHSVYLKQKRLSMAKVVHQHLIQVYQVWYTLYQVHPHHVSQSIIP